MASSPIGSPGLQPSRWSSPIVIAMIGTLGTLFLIFSYFNILKRCSFRSLLSSRNDQSRHLHDTTADGHDPSLHFHSRGLDAFAVEMIPVTQFKKKTEEDKANDQGDQNSTECSICLGEYEDEEWVKTIPNCLHVFHVSCIDRWFQTHSSCPLCRGDVFDVEVSVSTCESLGQNLIRDRDVDEERLVFYQAIRSHILQNSNFVIG